MFEEKNKVFVTVQSQILYYFPGGLEYVRYTVMYYSLIKAFVFIELNSAIS